MLSFHCQLGPQFSSLLLAYFNLCRVRVHISSLNFFFSCEMQYSPREIIHSQMTFIDRNQRTHKNKTVKTPPDENWRAENAAKSPNIWSGVKLDFFPLTAAVKVQEIRANFISILSFHPESLPPRTPTFSSSPRTLPFNQWKSHFISLFSRLFMCARRLFFHAADSLSVARRENVKIRMCHDTSKPAGKKVVNLSIFFRWREYFRCVNFFTFYLFFEASSRIEAVMLRVSSSNCVMKSNLNLVDLTICRTNPVVISERQCHSIRKKNTNERDRDEH